MKYTYFDDMGKKRNIAESKNLLFATQEEAEARCNELNKEVMDNGNR